MKPAGKDDPSVPYQIRGYREMTKLTNRDEPEPTKFVCHKCIGDEHLAAEVKGSGNVGICGYCNESCTGWELEDLADRIHDVLQEHFELTPDYPDSPFEYLAASEGRWERRGDPAEWIIAEVAGLDEEIATDITSLLSGIHGYRAIREEGGADPYSAEACYERLEPDETGFRYTWAAFLREIRSRSRFFNADAEEMLNEIFGDLTTHRTYQDSPVIREIGPTDEERFIWRGRTAYSTEEIQAMLQYPDREVGPPPSKFATAGRMNPQGIRVFYGAMEKSTCISELRPPVGSCVVLGKFELLRTVRLLDLEALTKVIVQSSPFALDYAEHTGRAAFLKRLVREISRPVMPQDQHSEYIATQVVAEYLASRLDPRLDGIIFPSSQTGSDGRNLVLFNHACRVEPYELPKGTTVEVRVDIPGFGRDAAEGPRGIYISEKVPSGLEVNQPSLRRYGIRLNLEPEEDEPQDNPVLRLDVENIETLAIKSVSYYSDPYSALRHRWTQKDQDALEQRIGLVASDSELENLESLLGLDS